MADGVRAKGLHKFCRELKVWAFTFSRYTAIGSLGQIAGRRGNDAEPNEMAVNNNNSSKSYKAPFS